MNVRRAVRTLLLNGGKMGPGVRPTATCSAWNLSPSVQIRRCSVPAISHGGACLPPPNSGRAHPPPPVCGWIPKLGGHSFVWHTKQQGNWTGRRARKRADTDRSPFDCITQPDDCITQPHRRLPVAGHGAGVARNCRLGWKHHSSNSHRRPHAQVELELHVRVTVPRLWQAAGPGAVRAINKTNEMQ
jgi:hypothetical protein